MARDTDVHARIDMIRERVEKIERYIWVAMAVLAIFGVGGAFGARWLIQAPTFEVGDITWGKTRACLSRDTPTYKAVQKSCEASARDGYFCYDEMFMWAHDLLDRNPEVIEILRDRFPLLFIDEAQDNSEVQSKILHRIFIAGGRMSFDFDLVTRIRLFSIQ